MQRTIRVEVSPGELIDKLTILEIKRERISDPAKLANVEAEYGTLWQAWNNEDFALPLVLDLWTSLREVNTQLWEIEDDIRECERRKDFGPQFVELARNVYLTNDRRCELKREINLSLGSALVEEKSYAAY